MRFQWLDYLATLRERKTWLAVFVLAYAIVSMPFVLARPPTHVQRAIETWFGGGDGFVVFMYVWLDLAMNKILAFVPVVLASGVVLRERDTGVLPVLASKPLSLPRYFAVRATSACAVMATLHVGTQLVGLVWFSARVPGFRPAAFLSAMSLHLGAALFATAFAAAIAAWVRHRTVAALVAFGALNVLVGLALVGFYQPSFRSVTMLNPISLGSLALDHGRSVGPSLHLVPRAALLVLTAATIALGAVGVRRMEA